METETDEAEKKRAATHRSELKTALMKEYEEVIKEFINQGFKRGIMLGREEERRRAVKALLRKGVDRKIVIEVTGLFEDEFKYLEES